MSRANSIFVIINFYRHKSILAFSAIGLILFIRSGRNTAHFIFCVLHPTPRKREQCENAKKLFHDYVALNVK